VRAPPQPPRESPRAGGSGDRWSIWGASTLVFVEVGPGQFDPALARTDLTSRCGNQVSSLPKGAPTERVRDEAVPRTSPQRSAVAGPMALSAQVFDFSRFPGDRDPLLTSQRGLPSLPCGLEPLPWVAEGCGSACLSRFRAWCICQRLPLVAPAGLHKCSTIVCSARRRFGAQT
jgi:hypothetical protein